MTNMCCLQSPNARNLTRPGPRPGGSNLKDILHNLRKVVIQCVALCALACSSLRSPPSHPKGPPVPHPRGPPGPGPLEGPTRPTRGAHPAQGLGIFKTQFVCGNLKMGPGQPDKGWAFSKPMFLRESEKRDPVIFSKSQISKN